MKMSVLAFISCRLDYCNSLFNGISDWLMPGCSLSRMLLHVSCRALDSMTTTHRCYISCTGFWFGNGWTSRQPPWSTVCCPAWLQLTWLLTVSCRLKNVIISCIRLTGGLVLSGRRTATFRINVSQLTAQLWNSLPADLRQMDISYEQFKWFLKTQLFWYWDRSTPNFLLTY